MIARILRLLNQINIFLNYNDGFYINTINMYDIRSFAAWTAQENKVEIVRTYKIDRV